MYYEMVKYKSKNPPVGLLVANYLGYKPPADDTKNESGNLGDLLAMFPSGELS